MPSRSVALALAALLGSFAPVAAVAQSHPIDAKAPDGWQMLESLPPYPKAPCTARMAGREINVNLSLNNSGVPVLILARPDWRGLQGDVVAKISVDGGSAEDLRVGLANNLALTLVQDPALLQKLKSGHNLAWTLPMGRFEGRIEGFNAALAAVTACVAERDGKATGAASGATAATSAAVAPTPPTDFSGSNWKSACDQAMCRLTADVAHADATKPLHLGIEVAVRRGGATDQIVFHLPPDADAGSLFALAFADTGKDPSGQYKVDLIPGSTRVLKSQDCPGQCSVRLPGGVIPADGAAAELDVGRAMREHSFLLMFYFRGGQRMSAAAALFRYKDAYAAALGGAPPAGR